MQDLAAQLVPLVAPATAVVCIGNELRGDDGAGPAVARELADTVRWEVYDAATAPENFLGPIIRGRPECVLVIDALSFDAAPGDVRVLGAQEVQGQGPGTHGPAPAAFLEALAAAHPCRCAVVGIQPQSVQFGAPLSHPVAQAVRQVADVLRELAGRCERGRRGRQTGQ